MTPEQEREKQIAEAMKARRDYTLKQLSRKFQCSVKTLYRVYERHVTRYESPTTEAMPE